MFLYHQKQIIKNYIRKTYHRNNDYYTHTLQEISVKISKLIKKNEKNHRRGNKTKSVLTNCKKKLK